VISVHVSPVDHMAQARILRHISDLLGLKKCRIYNLIKTNLMPYCTYDNFCVVAEGKVRVTEQHFSLCEKQ